MKLEVRGGCFAYPKCDRQILKEISFCAASGQTVAILGPNGAGKTTPVSYTHLDVYKRQVLVFAKDEKADAAKEAGADYVGGMDMVEKITKENWFDFDVVVASPDMMGLVGRLGKVLGPKGLMPSPKAGTVTPNVAQAVKEVKAGKIEYRLDKTNIIHCPIGKVSFGPEKLQENMDALVGAIVKAKPAAAKGQYIKSCVLASTMGPGVKVNTSKMCIRDRDRAVYCSECFAKMKAQG